MDMILSFAPILSYETVDMQGRVAVWSEALTVTGDGWGAAVGRVVN